MISLNEYLSIDGIIKKYLENIDLMSPVRRQHFLSRLKLCRVPQVIGYEVDENVDSVVECVIDICERYGKQDYRYIVDKYVAAPYKGNSRKKRVSDWLNNVGEDVEEYLALGALSEKLNIIVRSGNIDKINIWDRIYSFYEDIDKFIELHNADPMGLREVNGTLYVNFIGNAYYILKDERLDFPKKISLDDWRKTRYYFCNSKDYSMSDVYGVTHAVINGTLFYTQTLDNEEFAEELQFLERFLRGLRHNDYIDVGDRYTLDLVCEAALCEKLGGDPRYEEYVFANNYLLGCIDPDTHILQSVDEYRDDYKNNLERNEHCNILLIMLNRCKNV